jgi:heterodisulfide reductase subunit A-like polyferredoxin
MMAQMQAMRARIAEIRKKGVSAGFVAAVDAERCTACCACEAACPMEALSVEESASVNPDRCIGCGQCVAICPEEAISLTERD